MANQNTHGSNAGQSCTTSNRASCCEIGKSRALRIASPVPMPASVVSLVETTWHRTIMDQQGNPVWAAEMVQ